MEENANTSMTERTCSICLLEIIPDLANSTLLTCLHTFHTECVDRWFSVSGTCPVCRTRIHDNEQSSSDYEDDYFSDGDIDWNSTWFDSDSDTSWENSSIISSLSRYSISSADDTSSSQTEDVDSSLVTSNLADYHSSSDETFSPASVTVSSDTTTSSDSATSTNSEQSSDDMVFVAMGYLTRSRRRNSNQSTIAVHQEQQQGPRSTRMFRRQGPYYLRQRQPPRPSIPVISNQQSANSRSRNQQRRWQNITRGEQSRVTRLRSQSSMSSISANSDYNEGFSRTERRSRDQNQRSQSSLRSWSSGSDSRSLDSMSRALRSPRVVIRDLVSITDPDLRTPLPREQSSNLLAETHLRNVGEHPRRSTRSRESQSTSRFAASQSSIRGLRSRGTSSAQSTTIEYQPMATRSQTHLNQPDEPQRIIGRSRRGNPSYLTSNSAFDQRSLSSNELIRARSRRRNNRTESRTEQGDSHPGTDESIVVSENVPTSTPNPSTAGESHVRSSRSRSPLRPRFSQDSNSVLLLDIENGAPDQNKFHPI